MATLIGVMEEYTKTMSGIPRPWSWRYCDCIGLLFHVVNTATGRWHLHRDNYVPGDLDYKGAIEWLHSANPDPLLPYLKYLVDDSGLVVYDRDDWNIAIISDKRPLPLIEGGVYPIGIVPGVVMRPASVPLIMTTRGMASANIYKSELSDFVGFRVEFN